MPTPNSHPMPTPMSSSNEELANLFPFPAQFHPSCDKRNPLFPPWAWQGEDSFKLGQAGGHGTGALWAQWVRRSPLQLCGRKQWYPGPNACLSISFKHSLAYSPLRSTCQTGISTEHTIPLPQLKMQVERQQGSSAKRGLDKRMQQVICKSHPSCAHL